MAGEATVAASEAILKKRYASGLPKAQFKSAKFFASLKKREDFTGLNKHLAIQTEDPQAAGGEYGDLVDEQGSYTAFTVTHSKFYTRASIRGDALKRAAGDAGALVDLWDNETAGARNNSVRYHEIYCLGDGTGVLGTLDGASNVGTPTVTLADRSKAVNFARGAHYSFVSSATSLSPTVRDSGAAIKLTAIDRVNGVLTFSGNITGTITQAVNTDSLVLKKTYATGGVPKIFTGVQQWIAGGTNPPDLYGCIRNVDPTRLAGQTFDGTGAAMEDALITAESMLDEQDALPEQLVAWIHPLDLAELKKTQGGKVIYDKSTLGSKVPGLSFKGFELNGNHGPIKLMTNVYQPKGQVLMVDPADVGFESVGPAPHIQDYDGKRIERSPNDDVWIVRFGSYGQFFNYKPYRGIRILNWGAT